MMSRMTEQDASPIPPIETADDPVHSVADLGQRWRALMGPLGFGERLLWVGFIGPDRRFTKMLSQIPVGVRPQSRALKTIMSALRSLLDEMPSGSTVALLLTGPGKGAVTSVDRVWSQQLTHAAARCEVPLEPVFRANDEVLLQIATQAAGATA